MAGRAVLACLGLTLAALLGCSDGSDDASGGGGTAGLGGSDASSAIEGGDASSAGGGTGDASGASGASGGSAETGAGGESGGTDARTDGTDSSDGMASAPPVLIQPIERGGDYVLEFENIRFVVVPAGARITEFSFGDFDVLNSSHAENFGSTLWSSPQNPDWGWPPPAELDTAPYTVEVSGNVITMTSEIASFSNHEIRAIKRFSPDLAARAIVIEYSLRNENAGSDTFAPWEVTRVNPNGLSFFPSAGAASGPLATSATTVGGHTWFQHSPPDTFGQKLYADGAGAWLAHADEMLLFVKQWMDVPPTEQAPNEAEIELYDGTSYVELEAQGPYRDITPGAAITFTVRWYLRELPPGTSVSVGSSTLLSAVHGIID